MYLIAVFIIGMIASAGCYQLYSYVIAPSFAPQSSLNQMYEKAIEDAWLLKKAKSTLV